MWSGIRRVRLSDSSEFGRTQPVDSSCEPYLPGPENQEHLLPATHTLIVITGLSLTRGTGAVVGLCGRLAEAGADITILTTHGRHANPTWDKMVRSVDAEHGITVMTVPVPRFLTNESALFAWSSLILVIRALWLCIAGRVDILHYYGSSPLVLLAAPLFRLAGNTAMIVTIVTRNCTWTGRWHPLLNLVGDCLILCTSQGTVNRMLAQGCPDTRVRLLPLGIDKHRFTKIPRGKARETLELPTDAQFILYMGPLVASKGINLLERTLGAFVRRKPHVRFIVVTARDAESRESYDRSKARIQHALDRAAATYRIVEGEVRSELFLAAADIVLQPLLTEHGTFDPPLTVLEALAAGTLVVASRLPGLEELISVGHNGFLFSAGDPGSFAEALVRASDAKSPGDPSTDRPSGKIPDIRDSVASLLRVYEEFGHATP